MAVGQTGLIKPAFAPGRAAAERPAEVTSLDEARALRQEWRLSQAVALSNESEPHRLAAMALVALGRFEQAAEEAAEAVRLDPGDWHNFVEQARALVGIPERLEEARSAAQAAVQLAPHKVKPHLVAGDVELAAGEIESAARAFRQVFTIDPTNPTAYNELARLHVQRSMPARARRRAHLRLVRTEG